MNYTPWMQCLDDVDSINFSMLGAWLLVDCVSTALVLLLNGALVVALRRARIGCAAGRLAASLAAADFLVGVAAVFGIVFSYSCAAARNLGDTAPVCYARYFVFLLAHSGSWYSVAALGVDRYIAVVWALRYQHFMSNRNTNIFITGVWILAVSNACVYVGTSEWEKGQPCVDENFFGKISFGVVVGVNTVVVVALFAWAHNSVHRVAVASEIAHQKIGRDVGRRSRIFIVVAASIFLLSYTPLVTLGAFRVYNVPILPHASLLYALSLTFSRINAIANPVLYAWRNTAVRTAILDRMRNTFPWMEVSNFPSEDHRDDASRRAVRAQEEGL